MSTHGDLRLHPSPSASNQASDEAAAKVLRSEGAGRDLFIDALRGLSILIVIIAHFRLSGWLPRGFCKRIPGVNLAVSLDAMGYYGVVIFFVISGYLITRFALQRYPRLERIDFYDFWSRRVARILPLLLCCMAAMAWLHYSNYTGFVFGRSEQLWNVEGSLLCFRFNHFLRTDQGMLAWDPLWSLSVEELFYMGFPFVCLALAKKRTGLFIGGFLVCLTVHLRATESVDSYSIAACLDFLAFGCVLALSRPERLKASLPDRMGPVLGLLFMMMAIGMILVAIIYYPPFALHGNAALLPAVAALLVLISSTLITPGRWLKWLLSPFAMLGLLSYELYLLHMPALEYFGVNAMMPLWAVLLALPFGCYLVHRYFAEPMKLSILEVANGSYRTVKASVLRCLVVVLAIFCLGQIPFQGRSLGSAVILVNQYADLPTDSVEPLLISGEGVYTDAIFLTHRSNGEVQLGHLHGVECISLSPVIPAMALKGKPISCIVEANRVTLYLGEAVLLRSATPFYAPLVVRASLPQGYFDYMPMLPAPVSKITVTSQP